MSGVAKCASSQTTLDTSTSSADKAENTANLKVNYNVQYKFGGFLPPVTNDGNTNNAGSTIPIKFQLFDATNKSPINTAVAQVYVDGQPGTSVGSDNSGNHFRFAGNHYMFNLSTKGLSIGPHIVSIKLDDGSTHGFTLTLRSTIQQQSPSALLSR